ncbi:MAG: dienelactone hydrolase family protein [Acidimicrobiales bacterium]|nr:dienelactone hydrolase family protein [Acidimicrobiales bacterium]
MPARGEGWGRWRSVTPHRFRDRREAGRFLAVELAERGFRDPVVLGLPRGGVVVAAEVAAALHAPLDVVVVRKVGAPSQPELAIGAVGEGGVAVWNDDLVRALRLDPSSLDRLAAREAQRVDERVRRYRPARPGVEVAGHDVVVVDDGLATGATARAACQVVRARHPRRLVLAVPVAPPDTAAALAADVDQLVCPVRPEAFSAVGQWYDHFGQTSDDEVVSLLEAAPVHLVAVQGATLTAELVVPAGAAGLVVFVHGSGSSRRSPRNQAVAAALRERGLGTLLFDLLTPAEAVDRANVFDVSLLARRLVDVVRWAGTRHDAAGLPVGLFGASTGAAAALVAAPLLAGVAAVVSRGGRPDLAGEALAAVRQPVLLVVGGADRVVLDLNRAAAERLGGPVEVAVVPGAGHLFEEPGALEEVARLAGDFLVEHLRPR